MKAFSINLILLIFSFNLLLQTVNGQIGNINRPTGIMNNDGSFFIGSLYNNKHYIDYYGQGKYNCLAYYFDLTFLPFLEVNFRNTRLLNRPGRNSTVDRMISLRLSLLKEKKHVPAIVIGGNDIYTSSGKGNQYFSALYAVASKSFEFTDHKFITSLGYGFDVFKNDPLTGVFGSIEYWPNFLKIPGLVIEYDTKRINYGLNAIFFDHLYVFVFTNNSIAHLSGGIAYKVFLK